MTINFPAAEEDVLKFWKEIDAFQTQLRLTEGGPRFNFYDGPPFGMLPLLRLISCYFRPRDHLLTLTLALATGTSVLPFRLKAPPVAGPDMN